jgi:ferredoxin
MGGRRVAPRLDAAGGRARTDRLNEAGLKVDPIACDGIGMCAHLAPGLIGLDSWGFPLMPAETLTGRSLRSARSAAAGCPRKALFLTEPSRR